MAADNSFDIVSDVDLMEASNAVQQALKEIRQRFDFKGSASDIALDKETLTLTSDDESKLKSVIDILRKAGQARRVAQGARLWQGGGGGQGDGPPGRHDPEGDPHGEGQGDREVHQGTGVRVQAQIQEDQVRVTGKKGRPASCQAVKGHDFGLDLQFTNCRST